MRKVNGYPGQKNIPGLIQKIVNQIPECTNFYELYAGSAAVSTEIAVGSMVPPKIFLNDIDPDVNTLLSLVPGATISNINATDIIQSELIVSAGTETFVFIDPPYMHSTRPGNIQLYKHEMKTEDHYALILSVRDLKCNVMIIHPQNILYDHYLCTFRKVQVKIRYNNKTSIENLYMNYPEPASLQVKHYTGTDCWDRQRIKRKGDRLINKIQKLPVLEKNYLIGRIQEKFISNL